MKAKKVVMRDERLVRDPNGTLVGVSSASVEIELEEGEKSRDAFLAGHMALKHAFVNPPQLSPAAIQHAKDVLKMAESENQQTAEI